jgi:hypothetical protein
MPKSNKLTKTDFDRALNPVIDNHLNNNSSTKYNKHFKQALFQVINYKTYNFLYVK